MYADRPQNVAARLVQVSLAMPDALAFCVSGGRSISFGEYERATQACAASLRARGVGPGARVVVFVPMSIELYIVLAAVLRIGAVVVFIDPWIGRAGIAHAAQLTRPAAFVGVPRSHVLRVVSRDLRRAATAVSVGAGPLAARMMCSHRLERLLDAGTNTPAPVHEVAAHDHALITFTTGSTGTPKGADRTHELLNAQTDTLRNHVDLAPGDVHYTNLPIVALHNVAEGVTTAMAPPSLAQSAAPDGACLLAHVQAARPTVLTLSPGPLSVLIDAALIARTTLPSVQRVYTGGGPVLPHMIEGLTRVFPAASCDVLYGSTECEPIAHITATKLLAQRDAIRAHGGIPVGSAVDETTVRLVRPTNGALPENVTHDLTAWLVPDGAPGEVIVSGAHVNRSYFRNDEATAEHKIIEPDGTLWHRTGDVARRAPDGSLWLLGRVGSDVQVDGRAIYPLELTTALEDVPEIGRAALVRDGGDRPVLVVGTDGHPSATAAARRALAGRGLGADIDVREVRSIPLDPRHAAKVDAAALARLLRR